MRRILGIVFGAIAAFAAIMLVEWVNSTFFSVRDLDSADPAALAALIDSIPLSAKLLVVSGWLLGAFCGAWLALRISDWRAAGWIIALLVLAGGIATMIGLPNPLWMNVCAVVLPLVGGWLAQRLHHKPYRGQPLIG